MFMCRYNTEAGGHGPGWKWVEQLFSGYYVKKYLV